MKNKKVTTILLSLVLSFSISACGSVENSVETESMVMNEETEEKETSESTEEETETETTKENEIETAPTKEVESKEETKTTSESESETDTTITKQSESQTETKTAESKEETKPIETPTPTETPKQEEVHTHNYTSVVSVQQNCVTNGVKTFTCSCGDSYTENLGYGAHDYSVPVYQTVHHDAQYETIKKELPGVKVITCRCGAEFTTNEGYDNHVISQIEAEGPFTACGSSYMITDKPGEVVYDYVETSPAYDSEEIVAYKCSICGQQQ